MQIIFEKTTIWVFWRFITMWVTLRLMLLQTVFIGYQCSVTNALDEGRMTLLQLYTCCQNYMKMGVEALQMAMIQIRPTRSLILIFPVILAKFRVPWSYQTNQIINFKLHRNSCKVQSTLIRLVWIYAVWNGWMLFYFVKRSINYIFVQSCLC